MPKGRVFADHFGASARRLNERAGGNSRDNSGVARKIRHVQREQVWNAVDLDAQNPVSPDELPPALVNESITFRALRRFLLRLRPEAGIPFHPVRLSELHSLNGPLDRYWGPNENFVPVSRSIKPRSSVRQRRPVDRERP